MIQLIWKLKNHLLCAFESLGSWSFGSRVIVGFVRSLITWITTFPFGSCFAQFCLFFRNLMSMEFPRKDNWEKFESYNYVIKRKSGSCNCSNQRLNGWISWITKFLCLGIDISDHLYSRSVFSKQIVPDKWNVLSQSRALAFPKKLLYLLQWKLFKNYEKCFLFHVKSSFHSQDN